MRAQIVSFHCVMKNQLGQVLSSTFNQDVINELQASGTRLEGFVAGLQDLKKGEKRKILVPANRAYGVYDPKLVIEVPRAELQNGYELEIGNEVVEHDNSCDEKRIFRVIRSKHESVILDGNHPLAGLDLVFEIEVIFARDALDEDLQKNILGSNHLKNASLRNYTRMLGCDWPVPSVEYH